MTEVSKESKMHTTDGIETNEGEAAGLRADEPSSKQPIFNWAVKDKHIELKQMKWM